MKEDCGGDPPEETPEEAIEEAIEEAAEVIEEALVEAEEALVGAKLPFARWLIKIVIEKLLAPVIVPALTAAATAVCGWYFVGQYQVKADVRAEVEVRARVDDLIEDATAPPPKRGVRGPDAKPVSAASVGHDDDGVVFPSMQDLRDGWEDRYGAGGDPWGGAHEAQKQFPEELVRQALNRANRKR